MKPVLVLSNLKENIYGLSRWTSLCFCIDHSDFYSTRTNRDPTFSAHHHPFESLANDRLQFLAAQIHLQAVAALSPPVEASSIQGAMQNASTRETPRHSLL
jgi:hypothetical protein